MPRSDGILHQVCASGGAAVLQARQATACIAHLFCDCHNRFEFGQVRLLEPVTNHVKACTAYGVAASTFAAAACMPALQCELRTRQVACAREPNTSFSSAPCNHPSPLCREEVCQGGRNNLPAVNGMLAKAGEERIVKADAYFTALDV